MVFAVWTQVAAGLQVDLQVQLLAMCAAQAGRAEPRTLLAQDIAIHTETEILHLPVVANILRSDFGL